MAKAAEVARARELGNPLRLSNAGTCARRMGYQFANYKARLLENPEPYEAEILQPRSLLVFQLGDIVEMAVKDWIARSGAAERFLPLSAIHKDRISVQISGVEIDGHPDGLYQEVSGLLTVPDLKSINPIGFNRVSEEGPDYGNVCQTSGYAKALDVPSARLLYYNKATSHLDEWIFDYSPALWEEIESRFAGVIHSTADALPAREYEPEAETEWVKGKSGLGGERLKVVDIKKNGYWRETGRKILGYPCSYCPFKEPCFGAKMEMDGNAPVWVMEAA
jgi:hypothetical protein